MKKIIIDGVEITEKQIKQILLQKRKPKAVILKRFMSDKDLEFGVVSDTHLGSRYERLNELHTFYAICKKLGIGIVLHCGDLLDGNGKIYRGHLSELHTYGADRQITYAVNNYPKVKGITTYFVTGNHCLSFYGDNGTDIGIKISEKRDDMIYLGQYEGNIEFNRVRFRMIHPDGGGAYALSYKGQKYVEQIVSGRKPDVLIFGHWHTSFYFHYRNIHVMNIGCFQGQTPYLARKGLNPAIGGWICKAKLGKGRDRIVALEQCFIPFADNKEKK
tara:strand:- start:41 stop:862 length:822 start_codon:yes stop_codon:yes gene_type:complete